MQRPLSTFIFGSTVNGYVTAVAVTADGQWAVSGSLDKALKVWDLSTGKSLHTSYGETQIFTVAITPDGRSVVAGGEAGRVHLFSLEGF